MKPISGLHAWLEFEDGSAKMFADPDSIIVVPGNIRIQWTWNYSRYSHLLDWLLGRGEKRVRRGVILMGGHTNEVVGATLRPGDTYHINYDIHFNWQ